MRKILRIVFLFILSTLFSCEKGRLFINCPDCYEEEPLETDIDIKINVGENNQEILINVYEGNLEDSVLYRSFYTTNPFGFTSNTSIRVLVNKKYTITATYFISDTKYIAVDSATPRVIYDKEQCDNPCYLVYDQKCDLRLKYTK
jgi:hypothetical protein